MSNTVSNKTPLSLKISVTGIVLVILSLFLGTFLRIALLPLYPLAAWIIFKHLNLRLTKSALYLFCLIFLSLALSVFNGLYPKYHLLSLFYMLPFVSILFSHPANNWIEKRNLLKIFMTSLTVVATINNLVGLIQIIRNPASDDSFTGIYTTFSVSLNGLSILNAVIFTYYFHLFISSRKKKYLFGGLFFLISSILGFYGAGLLVFAASFILVYFKWNIRSFFKISLLGAAVLLVLYVSLATLKPATLDYNISNLKKIISLDVDRGPRKLKVFYNYFISYPKDLKDFLFGSGPGTFNSRSAFIVGSPSYFSGADIIKSGKRPYYFRNYAYSLWNESNTSKALFQDGFRNQPFSSILAFLGEYGFLFFLAFLVYYYRQYIYITVRPDVAVPFPYYAYRRFTKFLFCMLALLLLIDNYYEFPEIALLIIVIIKLSQIEMFSLRQSVTVENQVSP